jgi:hypothetical protein
MTEFTDALATIKAMPRLTCGNIRDVLLQLWQEQRPEGDDYDSRGYDWDLEFQSLTQQIWGLSTCQDDELMTAFAEDPDSGYPVFATDVAVLEFDERLDTGDGDPLAIHLWKELNYS